jgi:uncharacterized protein YdiU (UPF0061 family)
LSCEADTPAAELARGLDDAYYGEVPADVRAATTEWLDAWRARVRRDGTDDATRRDAMHAVNPKYVLRNYLAQQAIDLAEQGDASMVHRLLDVMRRPYDTQPEHELLAGRRPDWARDRVGCSMLSCSS